MLASLVNNVVRSDSSQLPRSAIDNPETLIPNVKYVYLVPEWLEKISRRWEDDFIRQCQIFLSGPSFFLARLSKMFHSIWVGLMAPLFFYLLGCDQYSKLWMSYLVVLLLAVLILKRFVWRHRPFTVKRAKMVVTNWTSSFPCRSALCAPVYVYLLHQMVQMARGEHLSGIQETNSLYIVLSYLVPMLFLMLALALFMITFLTEVLLGTHYPSDCIASFIIAFPVIVLGGMLHSVFNAHCPVVSLSYLLKHRTGGFLEEKMMQLSTLIKWGLFGAVLSVVLGYRSTLNWKKMYRVLGVFTATFVAVTSMSCNVTLNHMPPFAVHLTFWNFLGIFATTVVIMLLGKISWVQPVQWWGHIFSFFFMYCMSLLGISLWREWLPEKVYPTLPVVSSVTDVIANATETIGHS